jgi:capsular exopolysaccharide synthesis family protein
MIRREDGAESSPLDELEHASEIRREPNIGSRKSRESLPSAYDPWADFGVPNLADTVRRICFFCGWTQRKSDTGRTLAVTCPVGGEGTSSLASAIAISTASDQDGGVLLVECDLLQPRAAKEFELESSRGLADVLVGNATFADACQSTDVPGLHVLAAGQLRDNPSRLLRSPAMLDLLDEARRGFAFVLLDLPPVLKSSDAALLAQLVEGTILIVRSGVTEQRDVQQALHNLARANITGVVLNRWRPVVPGLVRGLIEEKAHQ